MKTEAVNDSSGRVIDNNSERYALEDSFTNREEIPSEGYNRLVHAVRYGKHFLLKGLKPQYADNELCLSLLRKEFEIMVQLNHPNIVRVYSIEDVPDIGLCIVMEYVEGYRLDEWLAQRNPSLALRKRVLFQLLDAMGHWHSLQVVHRDLKPSNILVTRNGDNVRVIDFGLSDTDHYAVFKEPAYTLSYASPEQLQGGPLDCRSDIYSFGRILQQLVPHRYGRIAKRCCRHDRDSRYHSAEAVAKALKRRNWAGVPIALAVAGVLFFIYMMAFDFTSKPFSYALGDGQELRVQIVDSEAHVVGYDTIAGDLVLPEKIKHGLFRYPLREIADRAFFQCQAMTRVSFPSTLRRIGDEAFSGCTNLSDTLLLTEGLEYIGDHVFDNCEHISACRVESRRLHVKKEPDKYGRFGNMVSMKDIIIANTVDTLCEHLFEWAYWGVKDIWIEEGLTHLGECSLSELYNLERIHFPSTLRKIDPSCFYGCGIHRLVIPDQIEEIDNYGIGVLFNCRYVEFGLGLKYLGSGNLYGYGNLDTIRFRSPQPPKVTATTFSFVKERPNPLVLVPAEALERYKADTNFAKLNIKGY